MIFKIEEEIPTKVFEMPNNFDDFYCFDQLLQIRKNSQDLEIYIVSGLDRVRRLIFKNFFK